VKTNPILFAFLAAALAGCTGELTQPTVASVEDDLDEAVFRYLLPNDSTLGPSNFVAFLAKLNPNPIDDDFSDLSDEFMARFNDISFPVKKYSDGMFFQGRFVDRSTGTFGILYYVISIDRGDPGQFVVRCGLYYGEHGAEAATFTLQRNGFNWVVIKAVRWITA
jgi:hypothetical protein